MRMQTANVSHRPWAYGADLRAKASSAPSDDFALGDVASHRANRTVAPNRRVDGLYERKAFAVGRFAGAPRSSWPGVPRHVPCRVMMAAGSLFAFTMGVVLLAAATAAVPLDRSRHGTSASY